MQVCTSLQTDNHASTPPLCFFTRRMPFLPPNQQRQSTEGNNTKKIFFKTAISILLFSNHNSFRVVFDKIASVHIGWQ